MVQHAVRNHQVETRGRECRAEQIHLQEPRVADGVTIAESVREAQGIQAEIAAEHGAVPGHAEEIGELSGAASHLEDQGVRRDLFVEQSCENASARLAGQALSRIQIVVIREWIRFVKRLHDVSDIPLVADIVRMKQARDAFFDWETSAARTARRVAGAPCQRSTARRTGEDLQDVPRRLPQRAILSQVPYR